MTSPGVRRYLWDDEVIARGQVEDIIGISETSFAQQGFGLWAILQRDRDDLIGFTGFWHFHEPTRLELLYGIGEGYWNSNFATEAAGAMLNLGFKTLAFDRIEASTDFANSASVRVMEKLGMSFWKREETDGLDTVYYAVQCPEAL